MKKFILLLSLVLASYSICAQEEGHMLVIKTDPRLEDRFHVLTTIFQQQGTDAVAESIEADMQTEDKLQLWQDFVKQTQIRIVQVEIHPNEKAAINWMNKRFQRMGLAQLQFEGVENLQRVDPTALDDKKIAKKKWLRYLAGPGVALAATAYNLPEMTGHLPEQLLLIVPAAGVGLTTILLEFQFAWPWMNNHFWKHVWKFGGRIGGRVSNIMVNFLYGMSLYGAGVGAAYLPTLWGGQPIPYDTLTFQQALVTSAVGGFTFHLAMGQFQTDISTEEDRGAISAENRYALETGGVVANNSARVFDWVVPGNWGLWVQASFFLLKTFPQLLKTNITTKLVDKKINQKLSLEKKRPSVFQNCVEFLQDLSLINLPSLRK